MAHVLSRFVTITAIAIACLAAAGTARAEFTTIAGWDKQIFPSYAVATATIRLPQPSRLPWWTGSWLLPHH